MNHKEKTEYERYEEYIKEISGNYVEAAGDDGWGGLASIEMAKQLHPYEDWKGRTWRNDTGRPR